MIFIIIATKNNRNIEYRKLGSSGLALPVLSLGCYLNFGNEANYDDCKKIVWEAFENGVSHFDLANNYGPPKGAAEILFGRILKEGFNKHRDEITIATKAGYPMWDGPYGQGGSKKHLLASIDQSLARLGIKYVDIFYHHRSCPTTPIKETILALKDIVRSGKALYIGLSNYKYEELKEALLLCREHAVPCVAYQMPYSLLRRDFEKDIIPLCREFNCGIVGYQILAEGRLTDKYLLDIPLDSRVCKKQSRLSEKDITPSLREKLQRLKLLAIARNQSIPQLAIAWALRQLDSVIIGVSSLSQLQDNLHTLNNVTLDEHEYLAIEEIFKI